MRNEPIPIIVLGGSDLRPPDMPDAVEDRHPLSGYKGVEIVIGGRPLIAHTVERLQASGHFRPVYIAGPASVYGDVECGATLIDTDGTFGENIRVALEAVQKNHPASPVAFITCDVLPEVETLHALMADFEKSRPCDMFFPMIRVPKDHARLGASDWKPMYRVAPEPGSPPEAVLPGHLVVTDPGAMRLRFLFRLFQVGYQTRNRSMGYRRRVMVRGILAELLRHDLRRIARFQLPRVTVGVLAAGLVAARRLMRGRITRAQLETALRRIFVLEEHRRRYPERRVLLPIVNAISLAMDIDTEEEAREKGGRVAGRPL